MCGIVGFAAKYGVSDYLWIHEGRDAMAHRGPDDAGLWWSADRRVGLAHRRLSILDLSPLAHQPMIDINTNNVIAFNGEIYNFRELKGQLCKKGYGFRSHSDTEVILNAYLEWGTDCLSRLDGMFAFALFDHRQQTLFLARDRAGEKPLFYHHEHGALRFASELKGVLADKSLPRRLNRQALDCYLAMGYVPGDLCILEGFNKLPPAHAMQFDLSTGTLRVWPYWQVPDLTPGVPESTMEDGELLDEVEALLDAAVRGQMVADVPVGVLLSGGTDSSLVTAMAARHAQKVKTFSIRFPGHGEMDETEHARLVARYFDTEHHELEVSAASVDLLPVLARQFDEPIADSSMIPTYHVCRMVRGHCTVALGGDGGDELFGGYGHYSHWLKMQHCLGHVPLAWRRTVAWSAARALPVGFKGRNWLQGSALDFRSGTLFVASHFDAATRRRLMAGLPHWDIVAEDTMAQRAEPYPDLIQRATRMDFQHYLPEDILVKVDRASMLNSLEVRAPFLNWHLIEFAFGRVPARLKANASERKRILRHLCARVLPPEFNSARKQGFSIPLHAWLREGPWREAFQEVLLQAGDGGFDKRTVRHLLAGQEKGRANSARLFALTMFELWRKAYGVGWA